MLIATVLKASLEAAFGCSETAIADVDAQAQAIAASAQRFALIEAT